MTTADIIRSLSVSRGLHPDNTWTRVRWGREVEWRGTRFKLAGTAGMTVESVTGEVRRYPRPRPDEVRTLAVGEAKPWECPECEADSLLYSATEDGFDWLFCPSCIEWHRKPIAAGVDEALCERCGVGVSALERLDIDGDVGVWCCAFCTEEVESR